MERPHTRSTAFSVRSPRSWASIALFVLTWAIAMAIFFRVPITSGFDLGFGERGDALIEMTILEHWRNVWSGCRRGTGVLLPSLWRDAGL